jgi:diphthamide synthase (EF-2-diphthine--ammonia ligase)
MTNSLQNSEYYTLKKADWIGVCMLVYLNFSAHELDSYMYQTVGHTAISLYAEAMGLPLFRGQVGQF